MNASIKQTQFTNDTLPTNGDSLTEQPNYNHFPYKIIVSKNITWQYFPLVNVDTN